MNRKEIQMKNTKELRRSDRADAFIAEPGTQNGPAPDELAEYLGEHFVSSATGAEDAEDAEDPVQDDIVFEALGGASGDTDESATFGGDLEEEAASKPVQPHSHKASGVAKRARDRQRRSS
jgi:hypothetical protein